MYSTPTLSLTDPPQAKNKMRRPHPRP